MTAPNRLVWIVGDDEVLARTLARVVVALNPRVEVVLFMTAEAVERALRSGARRPDACIVDQDLPDTTGLDLLERAGPDLPRARSVLLTGRASPDVSLRAAWLGLRLLLKPQSPWWLAAYLLAFPLREEADWHVALSASWPPWQHLSPIHKQIVGLAMDGMRGDGIADALKIEYCTLKKHMTKILFRTDCVDMREVTETAFKSLLGR